LWSSLRRSLRQTEVCRTVDPDIEVENDPKSEIEGRDPQLERGIAEVMAKLKIPVKLPAKPPGPVKTIK